MRLEFCERLHPAQQLLSQCGRNIWTCEELFEDGYSPREVVPYSNAHLEIVLKDTHKPHISRRNARGAQERFAGVEGGVKLASCHLQLKAFWYGEARNLSFLQEALAEIKTLQIREPRV